MIRNLSEGSVFKNTVYFSLPYMLSYLLQTLYGMADLFITGRFNSTDSITAVSIGSQIMHMITVMIVGLAMGATVTIGRAVGAGERDKASLAIGNTAVIFMAGSVVMSAVLLFFTRDIALLMSTPAEALDGTVSYLTVCFIGIPFITAYNVISSVFRGLGDSKTPMYFIAAACVCNIGLDCLFIGAMDMGPTGAALGTTISQTVSVVLALTVICRKKTGPKIGRKDLKLDRETAVPILKIGLPVAFQDGFIQIAFIIITIIANRRGLSDAAAVGIVEKVIGILFIVPSSMLASVSALAAQNIGAKKYERARKTLMYAVLINVGFGILSSAAAQLAAPQIIGLFDDNAEVIRLGAQYLRGYVWDCIFAGVHFCFSGYFCALGRSGIPFFHNVISIILVRVPVAYFMSAAYADNLFPMGTAAPLGSLLSVIICVTAYYVVTHRKSET